MNKSVLSSLLLGALASAALTVSPALAQYSNRPFFEGTVQQSQARALELAGLRLAIAEALPGNQDDEFLEQVEGLSGDFARFGGTLAAANPQLATDLAEAFEAVVEALESGADAGDAIANAKTLLGSAYDAVIGADTRQDPDFKAAVLTDLLLGEPGVAEGYEEAAEEPYAFSLGWAALQRSKILWAELAADADEAHRADAEEMIGVIEPLYPEAQPPTQFVGNPEEAEAPAQRLVGIIETIADADLYPGRDHAALAAHLSEITAPACSGYGSENEAQADETVYAVQALYANHLGELTNLFDPELNERLETLFANLVEVQEEDDDEAGEEAEAEAQAEAEAEAEAELELKTTLQKKPVPPAKAARLWWTLWVR